MIKKTLTFFIFFILVFASFAVAEEWPIDIDMGNDDNDNGDEPSTPSSGGSSGGGGGGGSGVRDKQCEDGKDNDGDGLIDLDDPGCSNWYDDDESSEGSSSTTTSSSAGTTTNTFSEGSSEETNQVLGGNEETKSGNWFGNLFTGGAVADTPGGAAWLGGILVLVIVALFLVYTTFFKGKKPSKKFFNK